MQERQASCDRLEIEGPVERAVAAANNQDVLAAEGLHLLDRVKDGLALIALDAGNWRLLRLETAATRGDDHKLRAESQTAIGLQFEIAGLGFAELGHHLIEMESRLEGLDLLQEPVDELLAGYIGKSRYVVDRLLGIKLGALTAGTIEYVDHFAAYIEQPQLEDGEEAARPCAHNDSIGRDNFGAHLHRFLNR